MRSLASLAAPLAVLAFTPLARADADLEARSRIDAVTVYLGGARVTRLARVEAPAGGSRVVLGGLPDQLDDDSIRVEGRGASRVQLRGVTEERVTGAAAAAEEARSAERLLERLQDEDRALEDRISAARARARFAESLRSTYSEERAKNLAVRPVATDEWRRITSFVEEESSAAAGATRAAEGARRDLKRRIDAARASLEKVAAKRGQTTKAVAVDLAAERPGAVELEVSYLVPAAGWRPVWDAHLAPESSRVELALQGSVWQRTGEDWSGVRLSVSTAQPRRALFVPKLEPRWLDRAVPLRHAEVAASRKAAAAPGAKPAAPAQPEEPSEEAFSMAAEDAAPAVELGLLAATFTAPQRASVDGAGQARKIPLARYPLRAELTRTAAPRLDRAAFLTARCANETGVPLLAGAAGVYVGDQFVGRAEVPFTPPGGEIELAFGADERIEIERRVLERTHDTSGLFGKKDVWRYRVRIAVKSRWSDPVKLSLLDLVPVARDSEIEVAVLDGSTAPSRQDPERPGVRAWDLELGPREARVVELRYEVRHPRGLALAGLE